MSKEKHEVHLTERERKKLLAMLSKGRNKAVMIQRAHILAGTEGSALHNSVFMRPKCHVLTIGTPRVPSGRILNQDLCNGLSGVQNHYIEFKGQETVNYSAIYDTQHLRLALNQWLIGLGESR